MIEAIPILFVLAIVAATIYIGIAATRTSRTASDFFVAGRSVSVLWNASAISGEYLSAASFMGIAGLVMKNGYDALWYPVCYATGYLFLLLFIAGPLRRFGAYTIPDFAEGRFDSPMFRKIAVVFVLFIGFFYTMPQMKGAGITIGALLGVPYWVGIVTVGTVITFNVALGGMKGITLVQAFQYWAKAFAISAPVFVLMALYGGYGPNLQRIADAPNASPEFDKETTLKFKGAKDYPANTVAFSATASTQMRFPRGAKLSKISSGRKPGAGEDAMPPEAIGYLPGSVQSSGQFATKPTSAKTTEGFVPFATKEWSKPPPLSKTDTLIAFPYTVTHSGSPILKEARVQRGAAKIEIASATQAVFPAGAYVPNAQNNQKWLEPFGTLTGKHGYPLLYTYSLIIALICGTAGLPHILVRFYTNPDGRAAKRTTLWVMALLGAFYVFTPVWGVLGRVVLPALYANNSTDELLIRLPAALGNKPLGLVLTGITSAGAFAAFMSTFSGLLVSMSGAMAHDVYGKILRPGATGDQRVRAFKYAAVAIGAISMLLGFFVESFDIAMLVGWAFAIAAASYFPLLLLGAWWRGLTRYGAAAGMLTGGLLSLCAIVCFMLLSIKVLTFEVSPLMRGLMEQPAIWGVPLSLTIMVIVSLFTRRTVPADVDTKMLRLHAPEEMGYSRNYIEH